MAAVDRQLGGIHIHHGAPTKAQPLEKFLAQEVVGCLEVPEGLGVEAPKELPEGVAVRKVRQSQEMRKQAVELQGLGVFHATNPGNDGEQMCQEHVRWMELPIRVGGPVHLALKETAKPQGFAELLENEQSAVSGNPDGIEGKMEYSWSTAHLPIP